ncbi:DUF4214 domain-containing protein [Rugamonas sp. DEMB1]|uniref:DUF4214 domain-containing protein n=1 Tax=Rugamonas sp. DEMB1 TaxID=3039386 RepID=UPI00244BCFC1|nr:DUF4214 domain-containing protein [Rugamonas sp. DEMB1]WGG53071.1 DUF4214 domain-containing protein [Rugamonas sp. DEMB1]
MGDGTTNFAAPLITGSASANATVKLYDSDGATVLGTATADGAGNWSITSSTLALGAHTLTARQTDLAGNVSAAGEALALTILAPPEPPATTVDGVAVTQQPVVLPDGGSGTQIVVPIVTSERPESSGSSGVADIPLVSNSGGNLLLAQVATGFGLTATGGASEPAGNSLERLIKSIVAATPDHPAGDQGHLTGNGVSFLSQLAATVPLLVQTIVPTSGATAPSGTLTLTGTSSNSQHTALVIDASHLAPGSSLLLKSVDFAAIVGSAVVSGSTDGQILTGDAASQQFIVPSGGGGAVFAGGGSDILRYTSPPAGAGGAPQARAAALPAGTTVLHGGLGDDNAVFNGASSDYTVEDHGGFVLVTAKTQPTQHALVLNVETLKFSDTTVAVQSPASLAAITGLYHDVLGRQADHLGAEFWAAKAANGASLGEIALGIISSTESQSLHPMQFNGNSAHDVELLYQAIFSRHSDSGGLAFWIDYMATGATLAQVAQGFLASDEMTLHKIGVQNWDFLMST